MRIALCLLAALPALASAQTPGRLPLWFVHNEVRYDPGLIRLAAAGCPEAWPFSATVYEDQEVRQGEDVHVRYAETCSEIQIMNTEQRLSDALDALYIRLGEQWRSETRTDYSTDAWDMRPRLVELHEAWKRYTEADCGFDVDLAFRGGTGSTMEGHACSQEQVDARMEWVAVMMEEAGPRTSGE